MKALPTPEQLAAIDNILAGKNVILQALPGSGKSAVAYETIRRCRDTTILIVSYNRSLSNETKKHLGTMCLPSTKCVRSYTFHGLASAISGRVCGNDQQFSEVLAQLETTTHHHWEMAGFTLLIIDEVQDMRPSLSQFVRLLLTKVCRDTRPLRMLLLGDPRQLLYHFYRQNRADHRFLTLADMLYHSRPWVQCSLTRSFRSTYAMAIVLNALVPGHYMDPRSTGPCQPVELYIGDIRADTSNNIVRILGADRHTNVLLLCPSTNAASPARPIVRTMLSSGIAVRVIRSGNLSDPPVLYTEEVESPGGVSVQTFCSSKGLEAPVVVVLCDRTSIFDTMENATYVALTRATRRLIIIADARFTSREALENLSHAVSQRSGDRICMRVTLFPSATARIHRTSHQMQVWLADKNSVQSIEKHRLSSLVGLLSAAQISDNQAYLVALLVYAGETEHLFEPGTLHPTTDTLCCPTIITSAECLYARSFEATESSLLGQVCYHLLYLHFIGCVARSLLTFASPSQAVLDVAQLGKEALFACGPYSGDMYDLVRFIPAVTILCIAYDAHVGYEDRLVSICSYSFAQRADVVRRLLGIIHTLETVLHPRSPLAVGSKREWIIPVARRRIRVWDEHLFIRYGTTGVCVLHSASIDTTDYLAACMRIHLYALEKMYLANTLDGSVREVTTTIPMATGMAYVADLCHGVLDVEETVDDSTFVTKYMLKK